MKANVQMITKKTMKLIALTITQKRLTWNSAVAPSSAFGLTGRAPQLGRNGEDIHDGLSRSGQARTAG